MKVHGVGPYLFVAITALAVISCGTKSGSGGSVSASVAGIAWEVPEGWSVQPARQMRMATYTIPGSAQGVEAGECAVFYFGEKEGGSVEMNIGRWAGQFELSGEPQRSEEVVDGMKVTLVDLSGSYRGMAGPMTPQGEGKPGYRLLGAIVEAPQGLVFFKLTGPAETVSSAQGAFSKLVDSVEKE
jgi:hypothetical protein